AVSVQSSRHTPCAVAKPLVEAMAHGVCLQLWERKGRDSNPRIPRGIAGFQDRCNRPLCHPSEDLIFRAFGALPTFGPLRRPPAALASPGATRPAPIYGSDARASLAVRARAEKRPALALVE